MVPLAHIGYMKFSSAELQMISRKRPCGRNFKWRHFARRKARSRPFGWAMVTHFMARGWHFRSCAKNRSHALGRQARQRSFPRPERWRFCRCRYEQCVPV